MTNSTDLPPWMPGATSPDVGSVDEWSQFIGKEDATQLLANLGSLGGSQGLLEELAGAILTPGLQAPGLAGAQSTGPAQTSPEEQTRRSEARLRALVDNLPCVTFTAGMGEGGNEVYINRYIEQLLGYSREEWLRDPFLWYWRLHPEDREAWNTEFARGLVTGGPWSADCRFLAADGRAVWVRGHARIVRDAEGRPLFLQGVAFDITSLKERELELERRLQEKESGM